MMKKIGIITTYYGTINYGGLLQAYALAKALRDMDYDAEQICFGQRRAEKAYEDDLISIIPKHFLYSPVLLMDRIQKRINREEAIETRKRRRDAFREFAEIKTPHTEKAYNKANIDEIKDVYDIYITGSDQVWNGYNYVLMLDFVAAGKRKISYSASIARDSLNRRLQERMRESLRSYHAISVREENDRKLIQPLCEQKVHLTADPVFLIDPDEWRKLVSPRPIKDKYVFCYFLGHNIRSRRLAKAYAEKNGYRIVAIPMFRDGTYNLDKKMGAQLVPDASPEDFLSYIVNAEAVVTDSFHAVAFSLIFEKPFFVLDRDIRRYMKSRIENIVEITGTKTRYCSGIGKESLKYMMGADDIDFSYVRDKLNKLKAESADYLMNSIGYD